MVPAKGWKSPELLADGFSAFSAKATSVLKRLISDETTIMLTTSHKSSYTVEEWKNMFSTRGIPVQKLKSLEPNHANLSRAEELLAWFKTNSPNEHFVIIDDDKSLNALPDFLKKNLVLTSPLVGLTDEHLEPIGRILHKRLQAAA